MATSTRRTFLAGAASGAVAATLATPLSARAGNASDRVRIGIIGSGNQGKNHVRSLLTLKDAEIVSICDPDSSRLAEGVGLSNGSQGVDDMRRIFDDQSIDAVTIAAPDHWHTPAALAAMEAGKHVYVEKPCSHSVAEGQMLIKAAKKYDRVVAHGTQARSSPGFQEAMALVEEGIIGDVLQVRAWNWQLRKNIGYAQPSDPPPGVDYDSWVGASGMDALSDESFPHGLALVVQLRMRGNWERRSP